MRVVLAGCGNMGFAMLQGWVSKAIVAPVDMMVVEPNEALRERAAALGVVTAASADQLGEAAGADIVVLAVKPQIMDDVAGQYAGLVNGGAAVVSVAAGTTVASLQSHYGDGAAITRIMPNTPAAVGKGMMVMFANKATSESQRSQIKTLMAASGDVASIDDEALMDAVTAVSGSGPAYVFHMIECLRDAGVSAGLPEAIAAHLAMQTIYGAAAYARQSGVEPGLLRQQVTSPNGTTQAGLAVLMDPDNGLPPLMRKTVVAACERSVQLGRS